jgi:ferrochelatase
MLLLVNFGGPRHLDEISEFLTSLLTDRDVIRTILPQFIQRRLFTWIARRRAGKIREDYELIGGRSPIYFDTEAIAKLLNEKGIPTITFHRYLPATHEESLAVIEACKDQNISVLPLFPQFSFATTGSIARFFSERLTPETCEKLQWIKSYPANEPFIRSYEKRIRDFLIENELKEEDTILLYSSHGVPQFFIDEGDIYQAECIQSFETLSARFPKALNKLSFQSKFGPGAWIKPYTEKTCEEVLTWSQGLKQIVVIPLSFTSDHIETLYEIETLYLPILAEKGLKAYRCPALNLEPYWIDGLAEISKNQTLSTNQELIRN